MMGDVNFDGLINITDIDILVNALLQKIALTAQQIVVADVNLDGAINVSDIIAIVNIILGT